MESPTESMSLELIKIVGSSTQLSDCSSDYENRDSTMNNLSKERQASRTRLGNLNPVFRKHEKSEDDKVLTSIVIKAARLSGSLNLSHQGLATVPEKVFTINQKEKGEEVKLEALIANEQDAWWNYVPLNNLNLSCNMLSNISNDLYHLESLVVLDLHDNAISSLPPSIGRLEKLKRINLNRNKLKELPIEFFTLPDLRSLNISYNEFEDLHPAISDLHMLETLDASNNNLTTIPAGIGFLVRLKELLLSHNQLKDVPTDLVNLRSLLKLDLMHNKITSLPSDISSLRKLQCLYLQHNALTDFPEVEDCADLVELHLAHNCITHIPENICAKLPHLKILDLRNNKLVKIPDQISLLSSLTRLDLTNNSIVTLPNSLAKLAHLSTLQLEGNPIKTIRRDVLQCGTARVLKILRDRSVTSNRAEQHSNTDPEKTESETETKMPGGDGLNSPRIRANSNGDGIFPDKYKMRKTRCLTVTMQNLIDIPDSIFVSAAQENVNIVDFSKNRLVKLPDGLQHLNNSCQELMLANNLLNHIDSFLSQFTRITLLNISCNNLCNLPEELGHITTLRELNINNNRFENIPTCVYGLKNLEFLFARDNRIKCIDTSEEGLGGLKHLANLNLRNNNIESVPPELGNLKNIISLDIIGNPFRQPRHQILQKGTEAIMSYLRDRIPTSQNKN